MPKREDLGCGVISGGSFGVFESETLRFGRSKAIFEFRGLKVAFGLCRLKKLLDFGVKAALKFPSRKHFLGFRMENLLNFGVASSC